jgi:hypothetical protein
MHRSEARELVDCLDCGAAIAPERERAFAVGDDMYLCFECAVRRGGVYDEREDRWMVPPIVEDEPDERRPHP